MLRKIAILFSPLVAVAPACTGQDLPDYGSETIYFLLTGRFHPHPLYDAYVDPLFPDEEFRWSACVVMDIFVGPAMSCPELTLVGVSRVRSQRRLL